MASKYSKGDAIRLVEEEDVEFIKPQFTDIFGMLKNAAITFGQLEKALDNRYMFDGSVVEGFVRAEETDMYLHPDLDAFEIFPWRPQQGEVTGSICDVCCSDNMPFKGDPRYVLKKVLKEAENMGYRSNVGSECEFFPFRTGGEGRPIVTTHEAAGYFDVGPTGLAENVRRDIVSNLEEMGFEIGSSRCETVPAQHEVDFKYAEGPVTADNILTFKMATKTITKYHGLCAASVLKPKTGANGSGMHINMFLEDENGKNIFADTSDKLGLSKTAYQFTVGILAHTRSMTILTNSTINSYKRLIPGYSVPTYVGWSPAAKWGQLIWVPSSRGKSTHIELRSPDSAVNPCLALATYLAAGLDEIKKNMAPPKTLSVDVPSMDGREWKEPGVSQLPKTLGEAIEVFEDGEFSMGVLGSYTCTRYLEAKKEEWGELRAQTTNWETGEYLYRFQTS